MTPARKHLAGKFLEAIGIAATMIALVQGIYGDAWGELYLFIGGIVVFFIGRRMEKSAQPPPEPQKTASHVNSH